MPRLGTFGGGELTAFGDRVREIPRHVRSMEAAARELADLIFDEFRSEDGAPECALVRVYKTQAISRLPEELADFARELAGPVDPETRCLTLLATRGLEPAWNDRRTSEGHKAIPLPTVEFVERLPMVAGLIQQLGLELEHVVRPEARNVRDLAQRTYGVFHVEHARGSDVIPAQDFVERYGIVSALGFGGVLYTGDFFAVVIFARVPIDAAAADTIRILSLATRVALMPFNARVFDD